MAKASEARGFFSPRNTIIMPSPGYYGGRSEARPHRFAACLDERQEAAVFLAYLYVALRV
jgi:hypothetical protein